MNFTELSFVTVPQMWEERSEIFKAKSLDMSDIKKIDSAGISFLVQWAKALPEKRLKLANVPENALNLISTYKVNALFDIEE